MPTIQIEADLSPEHLLNAARQLPRREFDRFVGQVLRLRAERIAPHYFLCTTKWTTL